VTSVQWQVSGDGGKTFTNINGATSAALTFTPDVSDSGKLYRVLFTNALGTSASKPAVLTVAFAPTVTVNPVDRSVQPGQTVTFTAAATGTPKIQWQVSADGGVTFTNIAGAASATLAFTAQGGQDGNEYRAVFTNAGGQVISSPAQLGVS
jgi:hypothetical protein